MSTSRRAAAPLFVLLFVLLGASLVAGPHGDGTVRSLPSVVGQFGDPGSTHAAVEAHRPTLRAPSLLPLAGGLQAQEESLPLPTGQHRLAAPALSATDAPQSSEPARGPPSS